MLTKVPWPPCLGVWGRLLEMGLLKGDWVWMALFANYTQCLWSQNKHTDVLKTGDIRAQDETEFCLGKKYTHVHKVEKYIATPGGKGSKPERSGER